MIRKTLLLVLLAAFAAIATEALSQGPASPGQPAASAKTPELEKAPPANSAPSSAPAKSEKTASPAPAKSEFAPSTSKESSSSKSFPTSSQAFATPSTSGRKLIVVERGFVTLKDDNKVPATEAGMLTDVPVKEGDSVDKDTLVAQIDSRSTEAKRRIAEGERDAALATAANEAEIEVAEKAVEVSLAELDQSKEIRLVNPRAVSESQFRKDKFMYEKSLAQVKQATNEKKIAGLTAAAKQAQYDAASIELELRQIRAPFKGQVVEIMKHVGDWVTVGEPIMHVVGLDRLCVKGFVEVSGPNGASHEEVIGKPVTITVFSAGEKKHTVTGIIGFASPVIEGVGTIRNFRVWAEVDNEKTIDPVTKQESWKIQPGSRATMTIDLTPTRPVAGSKTDSKSKVQSFKPVTGEADKSGEKKSAREF